MIYLFMIIFLVLLILSIKITKSIFSFPSFFIFFFATYLTAAYFFTKEYYDYSYLSFAFFTVMFIFVLAGFILRDYIRKKRNKNYEELDKKLKEPYIYFVSKKIYIVGFILTFILALANVYFNVKLLGFGIKDLLSLSKIMKINEAAATLRYSNGEVSNTYIAITLPFVYLLPLMSGFNLSTKINIKSLLVALLSFIPSLLIVLVINTKNVLIASVVFFICSFLVGWFGVKKKHLKITLKLLIVLLALIVGLVAVLMVSFGLRAGNVSLSSLASFKEKFIDYAFAGAPAFDKWLQSYSFNPNLYGEYTFISIWNLLGVVEKNIGVFQDFLEFGPLETNIYTAFRGLISDFGITGTLIVCLLMGFVSNGLEFRIKHSNNGIWIALYILIYSFFTYALLVSLFTYTSYILAFMAFIIVVALWPRRDRNEYQSLL